MLNLLKILESLSRPLVYFISYSFVVVFGLIDYATGTEISLSFFYLLPIAIVVWVNGKRAGIILSIFSTIMWFVSNSLAGQEYSNELIFYWNAAVRGGFFLTTTFLLAEIRFLLELERNLSRTDSLTGVLNRRAFYEYTEHRVVASKRTFRAFTLINFDIDDFKNINDKFGHSEGDRLLQSVGETLFAHTRGVDKVVRPGGDEFLIYLPDTGPEDIQSTVNRLLENLEKDMQENDWPVTFSLGVVTFLKAPNSTDEMISTADNLMYQAKRSGKNKVQYGVIK